VKLVWVRLREEVRGWASGPLTGAPDRRTRVVQLETDAGRTAQGEIAWLDRVGPEPDVRALVATWAWAWLGRALPSPLDDPALPAPVAGAITSALAELVEPPRSPAPIAENGLLAAAGGAPDEVARGWSARMAAHPDVAVWKIKVGRAPFEVDRARLRALVIPDGVRLRLDPNRAWGEHDPVRVARALRDLPIEYVEEPVAWPDLARWARVLPCAADESVSDVELATLAEAGIRAVVLKPSVVGGLGRVRRLAEEARSRGMAVVISSSLEGPVGRRHLEALVRGLPAPRSAAGLARDVLVEPPEAIVERGDWAVEPDPLGDAAARFPNAVAIDAGERLTFAAWDRAATEEARELGDRTGQRIALEIDGIRGAVRLFAILRAGAIACLVPPGVQRDYAMAQVGAQVWGPGRGEPPGVRLERPATLLWSSGSEGAPRAIAHRLGQHLSSAAASAVHTPFGPGDRWVASLRMHHVGGLALLFRAVQGGGTVVFPAGRPLAALAPTHLSWVPTQLLRAEPAPPPTLTHLLLGGAAAPPELVAERRALGWPVKTTWGSTELASQVCTSTTDADPRDSGAPLAGRQVEATPAIRVRGTTVGVGVWVDGDLEPLADADGWLTTGDVGEITARGTLRVHGRADAMFISGGENVSPESIERVLGAHPDVRAVVVVDVPDPEWGARPWAFVDGEVDLDSVRTFLAPRLPRHAWVDRVLPWSEEGVTATGKPRRAWFRARARAIRDAG